jgi:hypothetical protein
MLRITALKKNMEKKVKREHTERANILVFILF